MWCKSFSSFKWPGTGRRSAIMHLIAFWIAIALSAPFLTEKAERRDATRGGAITQPSRQANLNSSNHFVVRGLGNGPYLHHHALHRRAFRLSFTVRCNEGSSSLLPRAPRWGRANQIAHRMVTKPQRPRSTTGAVDAPGNGVVKI